MCKTRSYACKFWAQKHHMLKLYILLRYHLWFSFFSSLLHGFHIALQYIMITIFTLVSFFFVFWCAYIVLTRALYNNYVWDWLRLRMVKCDLLKRYFLTEKILSFNKLTYMWDYFLHFFLYFFTSVVAHKIIHVMFSVTIQFDYKINGNEVVSTFFYFFFLSFNFAPKKKVRQPTLWRMNKDSTKYSL